MVMLDIKLKKITNAATWKEILCCSQTTRLPLDPVHWVNSSKSTFVEHGHVAYQIKCNHEM